MKTVKTVRVVFVGARVLLTKLPLGSHTLYSARSPQGYGEHRTTETGGFTVSSVDFVN